MDVRGRTRAACAFFPTNATGRYPFSSRLILWGGVAHALDCPGTARNGSGDAALCIPFNGIFARVEVLARNKEGISSRRVISSKINPRDSATSHHIRSLPIPLIPAVADSRQS